MKNKAKLIDINILSSYMGRWLTWLVSAIVVALTLSALWGGKRSFTHGHVVMAVYGAGGEGYAVEKYSFLRSMLANHTRRSVRLSSEGDWKTADLLVISQLAYLRIRGEPDLVPVVYLRESADLSDRAVLISGDEIGNRDFSGLSAADVLFLNPNSMNGFLVQLKMLEDGGFKVPRELSNLRFAGERARDFTGVIFRVLSGEFKMGACRESDLKRLVSQGMVGRGELSISASSPVLPETIIACSRENLEYFRKAFADIDSRFERFSTRSSDLLVELARARGVYGFEPMNENMAEMTAGFYKHFDR